MDKDEEIAKAFADTMLYGHGYTKVTADGEKYEAAP